jgi:hypothetical protein
MKPELSETVTTKIAVIVRDDLATWQKLNITAFVASGVAASQPGVIGEPYFDATGVKYLPMFDQPVMVFAAGAREIRRAFDRAIERGMQPAIFTAELFATGNDVDNRRAIRGIGFDDLDVVGFGFLAERKTVDKICKGIRLHG